MPHPSLRDCCAIPKFLGDLGRDAVSGSQAKKGDSHFRRDCHLVDLVPDDGHDRSNDACVIANIACVRTNYRHEIANIGAVISNDGRVIANTGAVISN